MFNLRLGQYPFRGLIVDRIHSPLTSDLCFDNSYVGKQPVAWKECCAEYWLKELQESRDRGTGYRDITEILLKMAFNTIQSISQLGNPAWHSGKVFDQ